MSDYLIHDSTLEDIADAIRSKTGKTATMTPLEMPEEIASIESGTSITDGIVIKARNANGYPTEIDIYGELWERALSYDGGYYHNTAGTKDITTINLMTGQTFLPADCFYALDALSTINGIENITVLGNRAIACTAFSSISMPNLEQIGSNPFNYITELETVYLPKLSGQLNIGTNPLFQNDTNLRSVQLGSIGHTCFFGSTAQPFHNCPQADLVITIFTNGANVDQTTTKIRNGATNATIVIKASEETTYNGTTYSAGDTILTSEVV